MKVLIPSFSENSVLSGDLNGKEIQKRGAKCISMADLLCCIAEIDTEVEGTYTPIKTSNLCDISILRQGEEIVSIN